MPSLEVIQQSNASLRNCHPELTAVMLGATGGIGAATCCELVRQVKRPTLYIVGRNQSRASALILELKALNPTARLTFIQSDLTLLSNVDDVCRQITEREDRINLLFVTAGFLSLQGRDETNEGLDKMYSLQYFARVRAIVNLLPFLNLAGHDHQLARVVSVLGAGNEGKIFVGDLELKNNYNLQNCSNQAITMNSLALEHFARQNPTISFIHAYPGVVRQTGIMSHIGQPLSTVIRVMMFIATPFTTSISTCAKRQLYISTADVFSPPTKDTKSTTSLASFRVGSNGEICPQNSLLSEYLEDGTLNSVWRFTEAIFKRVSQLGNKTA